MSGSPLISVSELAALPVSERPVLLDVRWQLGGPPGYPEYVDGHIPGASYIDLETALADPPGPRGRHPLPDPSRFVDAMRRCGVRDDHGVLVYDADTSMAAARLWWLLRHYGHQDVRVLDGGYAAWVEEVGTVESGEPTATPGDFTGQPGHMPVLDAAGAERLARDGVLIDARAPERYRGETEPVDPVAGHIPGAVNMPATRNVIGSESPSGGRFNMPDD
ncbi:MAG: sulfurtransferase, partial [Actinomycetes bacterium]